jgi:hypothetical protein
MREAHLRAHLLRSPAQLHPFVVIPVSPQAKTGAQRKESLGPGHLLCKSQDDEQQTL